MARHRRAKGATNEEEKSMQSAHNRSDSKEWRVGRWNRGEGTLDTLAKQAGSLETGVCVSCVALLLLCKCTYVGQRGSSPLLSSPLLPSPLLSSHLRFRS
ncbi:hypothetical protein M758_2G244100 [Ceratodon purpureus]|nr:hypothetical protein M758_2G244100 [Ceratodon purpureus]